MNLDIISKLYSQYNMRTPKFTQIIVNDELFHHLNRNIFILRKGLENNILHQNIAFLDYELRNLVYLMSTSIVPLSYSFSEEYLEELIYRLNYQMKDFQNIQNYVHGITTDLKMLAQQETHSYELALKKIISYTSMSYTIVTKKTLDTCVVQKIKSDFKDFDIQFINYFNFTKNTKVYDNLIFVGSPKIYTKNILNYINANHFYFILYKSFYNVLRNDSWLEHERVIGNMEIVQIFEEQIDISYTTPSYNNEIVVEENSDKIIFEEPILPESLIHNLIPKGDDIAEETRLVESKLIELEGGNFLFEEAGKKAKCDILTQDYAYERKHVNEIYNGDYVILIDFFKWEDRKKIADEYFENENILEYRKRVKKLKSYLIKQIDRYGLDEYTKRLNIKCGLNLKEYQILGLTREETFKLQNDRHFLALLKHITQSDESAIQYFTSCKRLASFHNQIGRKVRNQLRNFLNEHSDKFNSIEHISQIKIPNLEFLKIELYKVKRISDNTYQVQSSKVGVPIQIYSKELI